MTAALVLHRVSVERGGTFIVRDFSTDIESANWLGIIGANGSGKTTLLRAIAGRLPMASGRCSLGGIDVTTDRAARADMVGFMPPIERLPGNLRIDHLLALAGGDIDEQQQRNHHVWAALGITALLPRKIGACSAGMRQRAAIALAFARPSGIVILDEPFNWLDPVAAFDLRSALAEKVASGMTLITALHDLATLCGFCDEGVVMADGRATLCLSREDLRMGQRDVASFEIRMIAALRAHC